jgi:hypothetical protein
MSLTLTDLASETPSVEATAFIQRITEKENRDTYHDLSFAICTHFSEHLSSAAKTPPLLSLLIETLTKRGATWSSANILSSTWTSYFLPTLALFGLAEGETEGIVISPTGMMHTRDPKSKKSDCGKEVNEKWLSQFHRGGNVHQLYRFSHPKLCSTCFSTYDNRIYRGSDLSLAKKRYAKEWKGAKDLLYKILAKEITKGALGKKSKDHFAITEASFSLAVEISESTNHLYTKKRDIAAQLFSNKYMTQALREEFASYNKNVLASLKSFLAGRIASEILAAPRGHVAHFLLTPYGAPSRMPSLVSFAFQAYGDLDLVPLPSESELAELLSLEKSSGFGGTGQTDFLENIVIPKLLVTCWLDKMLPLVVAAYPEAPQGLAPTLQITYRMMPGRKAPHLNGTRALDVPSLYAALDKKRQQLEMPWESVAVEMCLAVEKITDLEKGIKPDVDSFLTMRQWAGHGQFERIVKG